MSDFTTTDANGKPVPAKYVAYRMPPSLTHWALELDQRYGLKLDNPILRPGVNLQSAESWLERNPLTVTGRYTTNPMLEVSKLLEIKGERDEHLAIPGSEDSAARIKELADDMRVNGFDPTNAISVRVYPLVTGRRGCSGLRLYEGNHRVRAAQAAGIDMIPVEWRWCGGSEISGCWHPALFVSRF